MRVVERKPVPIYEVTCVECKSRIQYKASEAELHHITCPVCGVNLWADTVHPVQMEGMMDTQEMWHGRWLDVKNGGDYPFMCSKCYEAVTKKTNYCPNCGARMAEE